MTNEELKEYEECGLVMTKQRQRIAQLEAELAEARANYTAVCLKLAAATGRDLPELDGTDAAHPAWWRGNDAGVVQVCAKINAILDGADVSGTAAEPWESTRRRLAEARDGLMQRMLEWRGVETPCNRCGGSGRMAYGSTATWHGGIGGSMMTADVCNGCWGTGDEHRKGVDLRKVSLEDTRALRAELAAARKDSERLEWLESHPRLIVASTGYRGAKDSWCWRDETDALATHEAVTLRAAIDAARGPR